MDESINQDLVLVSSQTTSEIAACFATKSNEARFELEVNIRIHFSGLNLSSV